MGPGREVVQPDKEPVRTRGTSPDISAFDPTALLAGLSSEMLESHEFRLVLDLVPTMIWVATADSKCIYVNRPWLEFTGRRLDQELGDGWAQSVHPEDRESCMDTYLAAVRDRRTFLIEYRLRRRDGAYRWLLDTGVPLCDSEGRFLGYIGSCADITEHKHTDEALQEAEELYRSVVAAMSEGVVVTDDAGVIQLCNAGAERILGLSAREVIGRPVKDSRWGAIREDGSAFSIDSFPVVVTLATGLPCGNVVMGLPRPSGGVAWISINTQPLLGDRGWLSSGVVATFADITERKLAEQALHRAHEQLEQRVKERTAELENANQRLRSEIEGRLHAEQELKESEERFRRLAEASSEGIAIHEGGTILDANETLARMFGYRRQELIGKTHTELVAPAAQGRQRDRSSDPLFATGGNPFESLGVRRDGSTFPIEIRGKAIPYQGRTAHVTAVRDLTERKQIEDRARQHQAELARVLRLSTMGEMATGLAHELNQPLFAIINYTQGCLKRIESGSGSPAELVKVLRQVTLQAGRAGDIIRRLRNFVGKQESQLSTVDINDVVREAVQFLTPEARGPRLTIDLDLAEGLPEIEADMIQIEQVLLNLLRNACEALREIEEWPRRILVRTQLGDRGMIDVAIRDTGPGLSPAVSERLFQPFFTTKAEGMGLGLSISKSIIEAHGGRLWATPNPDRGVTFRFSLPALGARPRPAS